MNLGTRAAALVLSLLATATNAEASFDCNQLGEQEYRIYQGLEETESRDAIGPVKLKSGKIIAYEDRALLTEWFKPENNVGGMIPYKQPQIFFSRYMVDGQERLCSSQRHSDVFGAQEVSQPYLLRCISDTDHDGKYDAFRRYGELVSFDSSTGKTGPATGAVQADERLVQVFKLVPADKVQIESPYAERVLRTIISVSEVGKESLKLSVAARATHKGFNDGKPAQFERRLPSTEAVLPLVAGSEVALNGTKVRVTREWSGWAVSLPEGFATEAKLICGGIALETPQSISVFGAGSLHWLTPNSSIQ